MTKHLMEVYNYNNIQRMYRNADDLKVVYILFRDTDTEVTNCFDTAEDAAIFLKGFSNWCWRGYTGGSSVFMEAE